jgi:hypothetical protein
MSDPIGPTDDDEVIEQVAGAYRPRPMGATGELRYLPAWHDLSDAGRDEAFRRAVVLRRMEAALDADGLSTTARAVLALIRGSQNA